MGRCEGELKVSNEKNKQTVFGMKDWQKIHRNRTQNYFKNGGRFGFTAHHGLLRRKIFRYPGLGFRTEG